MSKIEVNTVAPQCGTTLTLGESGDTVVLGTGASQSGFGRSGSVNWQTGSLKTTTFTAADGEGYFINQGSAITVNLPAGSAGAIVAVSDYARNFATYNLTISPNGTEKIGGIAEDAKLTVDGQAATFVYVDSTKGWINVQNAEDTETGELPFISASGGTEATCGNFKTHIFTGPGSFVVSKTAPGPSGNPNVLEYLVVAGGGGGGMGCAGGGGGAGGFRTFTSLGCASPLNAPAGITATVQTYPIDVGGGGPGGGPNSPGNCSQPGTNGVVSTFSTITSAGGGAGGAGNTSAPVGGAGSAGGSGGGGGHNSGAGASGNTPSVSPPQGKDGKQSVPVNDDAGGGGGGAGADATLGSPSQAANGGAGSFIPTGFIGPTAPNYGETGPQGRFFAGGAGGSVRTSPANPVKGTGGLGGGADGITDGSGTAGLSNMGGGGSAGARPGPSSNVNSGGNGGSGIVMIRYKFQ